MIAVLVVGYNSRHYLADCFTSLRQQTLASDEFATFFIDNASTDDSVEFVRQAYPEVTVLALPDNLGFAGGNNYGIRHALALGATDIFLLNPDTILAPDCLEVIAAARQPNTVLQPLILLHEAGRKTELVNTTGGTLTYYGFSYSSDYRKPSTSVATPRLTALASGAAVMIPRGVLEKIGGFDEAFFLYVEDADLAWRARLAGAEIAYIPEARVWHKYAFARNPKKMFYMERNRWFFLLKNFEWRTLLSVSPMLFITECAVVLASLKEGWFLQKVKSYGSLGTSLSRLITQRRIIQRTRTVSDRRLAHLWSTDLDFAGYDSPFTGVYNQISRWYWRLMSRYFISAMPSFFSRFVHHWHRSLALLPAVLLVYSACYLLNWLPGKAFLGLLLWGYFPGYYALHASGLARVINRPGTLLLATIVSLIAVQVPGILLRGFLPLTEYSQLALVVGVNLATWGLYWTTLAYSWQTYQPKRVWTRQEWSLLALGLVPVALFVVRNIINPYIVDQDGVTYLRIMQDIKQTAVDASFLQTRRAAFTGSIISAHTISGISLLAIIKHVLPGLLWIALGGTIGLVRDVGKHWKWGAASLAILMSPAFIGHIDRVKPESLVFPLWMTVVILFALTATKRHIWAYGLGLLPSFIAFRSHDTGAVVLLTYLIGVGILIRQHWNKVRPVITWQRVVQGAVIIFPYLIIFNITQLFDSFRRTLGSFPIRTLDPQWWFLDSFDSGGTLVSWPGWSFLLFYIFNGAIALVLVAVLWRTLRRTTGISRTLLFLPMVSLVIYLLVAEGLPRLGIFLLPDRAWSHLFYDACLVLIAGYIVLADAPIRMHRWVTRIFSLAVCGGVVAATVLTISLGSVASRQEADLVAAIRTQTEPNAVILSTQQFNNILVEVYGQREFLPIPPEVAHELPLHGEPASLTAAIREKIEAGTLTRDKVYLTTINKKVVEVVTTIREKGALTTQTSKVIADETRNAYENQEHVPDDAPLYLVYSFAKTDGLLARLGRAFWIAGVDAEHRNAFTNLSETMYKEDSGVLLRIR